MNQYLTKGLAVLLIFASCLLLTACSVVESGREDPIVIRVAEEEDERQKEIDELRKEIQDSTKYGGGETKEWNERYLDHEPNSPYQGPTSGSVR